MKRKRILWTCVLPESLIARHGLSFAACNFSFNLMSGGAFDEVYSGMPLYVGGAMEAEAFSDPRFTLVYDRHRQGGSLGRKLATFFEQWTIFRRIPSHAAVWLYNLNTLNALLFVLLRLLKPSVQVNVIVLDFTPVAHGFGLNRIYLRLINLAHGRICLATSPLFRPKNSLCLPGVVPGDDGAARPLIEEPRPTFLLSGVLADEISMLPEVLKAFSQLPDCELHITGTKGDEALLKDYAARYPHIHWHGQLPFAQYLDLLHSVTFQLSTRDENMPENRCNFPSKIMEALYHNRIVVSTITYPQLGRDVRYYLVRPAAGDLAAQIGAIAHKPAAELMLHANQGALVARQFGTDVWRESMEKIEQM